MKFTAAGSHVDVRVVGERDQVAIPGPGTTFRVELRLARELLAA
jgi:hypothetical protein